MYIRDAYVRTDLELIVRLGDQSADITPAVEAGETDISDIGAGDQVNMQAFPFGEYGIYHFTVLHRHAYCTQPLSHMQGLMYGYATDETKEMIPLSLELSHQLLKCVVQGEKCTNAFMHVTQLQEACISPP